jgi:hypothetical protein
VPPYIPESNGHVLVDAPGIYVVASVPFDDHGAVATAETLPGGVVVAGMAIKQRNPNPDDGRALQQRVKAAEPYYLQTSREGRFKLPEGVVVQVGTPVYIDAADNTWKTAAGATRGKLGVVSEVAPTRGVPSGFVTVNMDLRSII